MGGLTREEAEQRIEQDTGDADDEVWVKRSSTMGRQTYHDERDCQSLQTVSECRSIARKQAHRRLFAPCQWCVVGRSESV
jgi:hypothetical protein